MGGSNQPSKWWMPKDSNFGVPQPQYVIPAAYINKQAAEWPQGRYLPPCIIPPPTVTYNAGSGTLLINGTSVYIGAPACPNPNLIDITCSGLLEGAIYQSPEDPQGDAQVQITFLLRNTGPDTAHACVARIFNLQGFVTLPNTWAPPQVRIYFPYVSRPEVTATIAELAAGVILPDIGHNEYLAIKVNINTESPANVQASYLAAMQLITIPGSCCYSLQTGPSIYSHSQMIIPAGVDTGGGGGGGGGG